MLHRMLVIDVTNVRRPTCVGRVRLPGFVNAVAVTEDYTYVADKEGHLYLLELVESAAPTLVSTLTMAGQASDVAVAGNDAFVAADDAGVHRVDISNSVAPVWVDTYSTIYSALGMDVAQGHVLVADSLGDCSSCVYPMANEGRLAERAIRTSSARRHCNPSTMAGRPS